MIYKNSDKSPQNQMRENQIAPLIYDEVILIYCKYANVHLHYGKQENPLLYSAENVLENR
ncbi:hypothetical protein CSR02_01015 [Acetobacter pomorum]|uniref:Uncharacterized protein n=1 Tax=Acetobacter pomorum TaxID=65959 RepID=A0A2G4RFT6_9PROT|nr:hypothetical protein CSR02_01015 [Acetobacter pomorum]